MALGPNPGILGGRMVAIPLGIRPLGRLSGIVSPLSTPPNPKKLPLSAISIEVPVNGLFRRNSKEIKYQITNL